MARLTKTRKKTKKRRQKADEIKIAHTAAFELCEGGSCKDPKISTDEHIWCRYDDNCGKGCYCQLFRRAVTAGDKGPWLVAPVDHKHDAKHEPKDWNYKCLCVRPIFEVTYEEDGVEYKARLQLCGTGACELFREKKAANDALKCEGECGDKKCKCTLFKLSNKDAPNEAKWELVAKTGKSVPHEDGYYYRCFCVK